MMNKAQAFRKLLSRSEPVVLAGAHNALSAKLVEEAGFEAIWGSGFEISAAWGVPDASTLTMTENLDVVKQISDAVSIPVIADGDTGYGNAINVMRTIEAYEQAGIAGISLEDNIFPKRCSFYTGVQRELVAIEEHAGKIRAAKAAQKNPDFVVIARSEALIAGLGMEEALLRAGAYARAGADAILVHSKAKNFEELKAFARLWFASKGSKPPLVIVPTTFPAVTVPELQEAGFKVVIFANHGVRASIKAMRETLTTLRKKGTIQAVSDRIVPMEDVYSLMGLDELKAREKQFLQSGDGVKAIIAAAGFEKQLLPLIQEKPKCLLDIKGKTILERQVEILRQCGIQDITVIRGYQKDRIQLPDVRYYDNDDYETTGELYSLFCAREEIKGPFIFLYSDILFDAAVLQKLLRSQEDISLVADRSWPEVYGAQNVRQAHPTDFVITRNPPASGVRFLPVDEEQDTILKIGQQIDPALVHGEFIGLARFSQKGAETLKAVYDESLKRFARTRFHEAENIRKAAFTDIVQELIQQGHKVACDHIYKGWMEVDTFEDYQKAWAQIKR
jgi:phosphoenolpyruvate phosphomutase